LEVAFRILEPSALGESAGEVLYLGHALRKNAECLEGLAF
jgi:hypothetical protein